MRKRNRVLSIDHFKDIKMYPHKLNSYGDVNWGKYVSALTDIGFDGCTYIEAEDKAFESCKEKILDSVTISKRYMDQFVI